MPAGQPCHAGSERRVAAPQPPEFMAEERMLDRFFAKVVADVMTVSRARL